MTEEEKETEDDKINDRKKRGILSLIIASAPMFFGDRKLPSTHTHTDDCICYHRLSIFSSTERERKKVHNVR